ncbi:MAG: ABC transporter ATP-binding protein [Synechococcales cyanobacterium]
MFEVVNVSKVFPNGFVGLQNIHLSIQPGEIVSLVGTSGCGKSTLLRILSGLDHPSEGQVKVDGQLITEPHPEVGIIFQDPRLMPWLSVLDNIQFGIRHLAKVERIALVEAALHKVNLEKFIHHLPRQLSGGMAQRVAIARALVGKPSILLLDEPFSALDAFTRMKLQDHILDIWTEDQLTMVLVTHDIEEALLLSDRVVVLRPNPGHIHTVIHVDLPRPRRRTDARLQRYKEDLLEILDLSDPIQTRLTYV